MALKCSKIEHSLLGVEHINCAYDILWLYKCLFIGNTLLQPICAIFVKFYCILSHAVLSILLSCDHMCSLHAVLSAHMRRFDES
jgi:hypothetical protein